MFTHLPNRYHRVIDQLDRDLQFGFHHFEPFTKTVSTFVTQEFDRYTRRFEAVDKDGVLMLTLELPGFASSDVAIKFERGLLTVTAKRKDEDDEEHSLNVGRDIDPDQIDAALDKGILTLKLHRLASSKPRDIPVK